MPVYTLVCEDCEQVTEQFALSYKDKLTKCSYCEGNLVQRYHPSLLLLRKGAATPSFETYRKFTQPHKSHTERKRDYHFLGR